MSHKDHNRYGRGRGRGNAWNSVATNDGISINKHPTEQDRNKKMMNK